MDCGKARHGWKSEHKITVLSYPSKGIPKSLNWQTTAIILQSPILPYPPWDPWVLSSYKNQHALTLAHQIWISNIPCTHCQPSCPYTWAKVMVWSNKTYKSPINSFLLQIQTIPLQIRHTAPNKTYLAHIAIDITSSWQPTGLIIMHVAWGTNVLQP